MPPEWLIIASTDPGIAEGPVKRRRHAMSAQFSTCFTVVAAFLLVPHYIQAADMPRQGTDIYTTTYVMTSSETIKLGDRTVVNYDTSGITRNDNGGAMFNNMSARCLGTREAIGTEATNRGTCLEVDRDGDQIFSTYEARGSSGAHTFFGGTGKYAGMSGTAECTGQAVKSSDGRSMTVVTHKATWRLPTS